MSHTRRDNQEVVAFSASKQLIAQADQRAVERGMTRSGYYRFCLARELGYSEEEAKAIGQHGAILQLREKASRYPATPRAHSAVVIEDEARANQKAGKLLKSAVSQDRKTNP
jgi:hypothetical protein